jgi:hypothetical protein
MYKDSENDVVSGFTSWVAGLLLYIASNGNRVTTDYKIDTVLKA